MSGGFPVEPTPETHLIVWIHGWQPGYSGNFPENLASHHSLRHPLVCPIAYACEAVDPDGTFEHYPSEAAKAGHISVLVCYNTQRRFGELVNAVSRVLLSVFETYGTGIPRNQWTVMAHSMGGLLGAVVLQTVHFKSRCEPCGAV